MTYTDNIWIMVYMDITEQYIKMTGKTINIQDYFKKR